MPTSLYSDGLAAMLGELAPAPQAGASAALLGPPRAAEAGRGGHGHRHAHAHRRGGYYGDGFAVLVGEPVEVVEVASAAASVPTGYASVEEWCRAIGRHAGAPQCAPPVAAAAGGVMGVDEFLRYGQRVNSDVLLVEAAVKRAMDRNLIDGPWWQSFQGFRNSWSQFYDENISHPPLMPWQGTGSLDTFADQAAGWAKALIEKTKGAEQVPGVPPAGKEKGSDILPKVADLEIPGTWLGALAIAAVGALAIAVATTQRGG